MFQLSVIGVDAAAGKGGGLEMVPLAENTYTGHFGLSLIPPFTGFPYFRTPSTVVCDQYKG